MSLSPTWASGCEELSAAAFGSATYALPSITVSGSEGQLGAPLGPALHALPSLSSTSLPGTEGVAAKPGAASQSLTLGLPPVGPDDGLSLLQVRFMHGSWLF